MNESREMLISGQKHVTGGVGPVFSSCAHLRAMLDQGWQIELPVYVRPHWRTRLRSKKENTYHFVLWHGNRVALVSVLDCLQVQQFLADNDLAIDHL
jgi:hypothetical protein